MNTQNESCQVAHTAPSESEFAALLSIRANHKDTGKWVQARIIKLGLGKTCSRCGGSGEYSFCQMHGTTCFKCGGSGYVGQNLTSKLYKLAQDKVEDGSNAEIMAENAAAAMCRNAVKSVMDAWQAVSNPYQWQLAAKGELHPLHRKAADFNLIMCKAYESVQAAEGALTSASFMAKRGASVEKQEAAKASIPALRQALLDVKVEALRTIQDMESAIAGWHASLSSEELAELQRKP